MGAGWLSLGAAPVFALMALWTGLSEQADMLCMSMHDSSPFNGMALMYALTSIVHGAPLIKLISSRRPQRLSHDLDPLIARHGGMVGISVGSDAAVRRRGAVAVPTQELPGLQRYRTALHCTSPVCASLPL